MRRSRTTAVALLVVALTTLGSAWAEADQAQTARLTVTVVDQSRAVIPGAEVTVTGLEAATTRAAVPAGTTTTGGAVTLEDLAPGRYAIAARFPGFQPGLLKDVRLRAGENRHVVVLQLERLESEVTVQRDRQAVAAERTAQFGTALTREQIESLSDDPAEMQQQLLDMAGPDAVLRVDSFEGGRLPPKSQIKSIHITRDAFAAENHFANGIFVDIITQPGVGSLRGGGNLRLRDDALNSRNPFTPTKGDEATHAYGMTIGGSLRSQKSSFSLSVNGQDSFDTPVVYVAQPDGSIRSDTLALHRPLDNVFISGLVDYALTRDQTLRVSVQRNQTTTRNLGVGAYDLAERAYSTENANTLVRVQEAGPLGRRFFTNTRLQVGRLTSESTSAIEARTFRVTDARTNGGAQVSGGRKATTFSLQSDLDYVRAVHSLRTGVSLEGGGYHSDDATNYLGTYFFESMAAFEAGRPRSFTRRIGDPTIDYDHVQGGVYLQDDIRVRKNLTLSPGVRYELQTHLDDWTAIGPRFGMTWAPFKNGRTSLRASVGRFYDWLPVNVYEQTLRVNGIKQQEINILNPAFPDPGSIGEVGPTNKYLLSDDLSMVRSSRVSAGVDQTISPRVRIAANIAFTRGRRFYRGRNLNAPVNGVRPDPTLANVVEVVGDAAGRQRVLNVNGSVSLAPPSARLNAARFNWRRTSFNALYSTGAFHNNTDGPFSLPFSGSPAGEWAEIPAEIRHHRVNFGISTTAVKNLSVSVTTNAFTGTPYTQTTGRDDNADLVYNDRPAGVGRNTLWTPGQWTVAGNVAYTFLLGTRTGGTTGITGIAIREGGAATVITGSGDNARYRLSLTASISNLANHTNFSGFTGAMTSPFYREPTSALGMRKIDIGINFTF